MKPGSHHEESLFNQALQRASGPERDSFLRQACAGDDSLLHRLIALLHAHENPEPITQPNAPAQTRPSLASTLRLDPPPSEAPGSRIGRYKILEQIGEGGCGVVYVAQQDEPVRRRVALKVIKLGMDTKSVIARFEAERQALAIMDHPNIAKVLDAGATDSGRPFFVMELVRGRQITDYCDEAKLSIRARLDLFVQVCRAVQHAHQKGIIHRDLKPSNILVTVNDGVAVPKVIDFGIAKATNGQQLTDKTVYTAFEQFIGTPAYMSPEQAVLTSVDIDTRSDIYALGVLLYELLTGRTPFDARELLAIGFDEMRRTIRDQEPARPSTRLDTLPAPEASTTAQRRGLDAPKLATELRGDLDWIVMKCLEKDRARRYETANGLALDIQRHLQSEPVAARPPSAVYRLQKLIRRNKVGFFAGAAIASAVVTALIVTSWSLVKADRARRRAVVAEQEQSHLRVEAQFAADLAQAEAKQAKAAEAQANSTLSAVDFAEANLRLEQNDPPTALAYLVHSLTVDSNNSAALHRLSLLLTYHSWMIPTLILRHDSNAWVAQFSPDDQRIATCSYDHTARIWDAHDGRLLVTLRHQDAVTFVHFSPDGTRVLTSSDDASARLWDARTGQPVGAPMLHAASVIYSEFSPDGSRVATASADHTARIWDATTGRPAVQPLQHAGAVYTIQFSPDGSRVVTASQDYTARVWNTETGQPLTPPLRHAESVTIAQFSPDGREVVTGSNDHSARVWDASTGQPLTPPLRHDDAVDYAEFSPDGSRIVTASPDGTSRLWSAQSGGSLAEPNRHGAPVFWAHFNPQGNYFVTTSYDHGARLWDASTSQLLAGPLRHDDVAVGAWFSHDGKRLVTTSFDGTARVWDGPTKPQVAELLKHNGAVTYAQFSPDGDRIVTASDDRTARVWDARTAQALTPPLRHAGVVWSAQFSPDGKRLATVSSDNTARVWSAITGQPLTAPLSHDGAVWLARFSPDGSRLLTSSQDTTARLWNSETGESLAPPLEMGGVVWSIGFSPDGNQIVTAGSNIVVRLWDGHNGQPTGELRGHSGPVDWAEFSPDGRSILTASQDYSALLWDARSLKVLTPPLKHKSSISIARFSPDGASVVTASYDMTACLWDARTGRQIGETMRHKRAVRLAIFSPNGKVVATSSEDQTARLWDAVSGKPLSDPMPTEGGLASPDFSPDGARLILASGQNAARVWDVAFINRPTPWLLSLAEALAGRRINAQDVPDALALDPIQTITRLRQQLQTAPPDAPGAAWGRWLLDDSSQRSISPFSTMSMAAYLQQRIDENTSPSLDEARKLALGDSNLVQHIDNLRDRLAQIDALRASANSNAQFCHFISARQDFARLIEMDPADSENYRSLGALLVQLDDLQAYRLHCQAVLQRFGQTNDPTVCDRLAKDLLTFPPSGLDVAAISQLADLAVTLGKSSQLFPWFAFCKALAEYRSSHFEAAVTWVQLVQTNALDSPHLDAGRRFILAMADFQIGRPQAARSAFDEAANLVNTKMPKIEDGNLTGDWIDWIVVHALQKEASSLILSPSQAPNP